MKDLEKNRKKIWWSSVTSSIILFILGLLLFLKPDTVIHVVALILGIFIIVVGIFALLKYFRSEQKNGMIRFNIIYGGVCIVSGLILALTPSAIASILPIVLGIWMIISSLLKIQYALNMKEAGSTSWIPTFTLAMITLVVGILLVINPWRGAQVILQIVGGFLMAYALLDVIASFLLNKETKTLMKVIDADIPDAEIKEEK